MSNKTQELLIKDLTKDIIKQRRLEEIYLHSTIWKSLLRIIIPTVLSMSIFALYSIIDQIIAIKFGSGKQLFVNGNLNSQNIRTIIQLAQPFWGVLIGVGVFISTGVGNKFGTFLGQAKFKSAKNTLSNGYFYNIVFYFILVLVTILFSKKIIELQFKGTNTSDETYKNIIDLSYYTTLIWSLFSIFFFVSSVALISLRVEGYPTFAFITVLISSIANIILDLLFTTVFKFGVLGTIFATGIAWFVQLFFSFLFCYWKKVYIVFASLIFKKDIFVKSIIFACFIFGFPSLFRNFAQAINTWFFNFILNLQGKNFSSGKAGYWVSIYGAITPIINLFVISIFGFLQSMNIFIPYNYAHKKSKRIIKSVYLTISFVIIYLIFVEILCLLIGKQLLSLFISSDDKSTVLHDGIIALRNLFLLFPLIGVGLVISGFYQSTKKSWKSIFIVFMRFILIYFLVLIILYFLGKKNKNPFLVFFVTPITDLIVTCFTIPMLLLDFKKLKTGKHWQNI